MQQTIDLDPQQQTIVELIDGIFLVLAGPGSGKTRVLTRRVAHLLSTGVDPHDILLLTFTNKAAQEMMDRVRALISGDLSGLWGGTFHSVAAKALREVASDLGYSDRFGIMDGDDAEYTLKSLMVGRLPGKCKATAKQLLSLFSFCRNTRTRIADRLATHHAAWEPFAVDLQALFIAYQQEKLSQNVMDFDDLLINFLTGLKQLPHMLDKLSMRFRFIMLDEAQDTNIIQWEIIYLLASHYRNLMVVGDLDQSIYAFRGADVDRFMDFLDRYPEAQRFDLDTNYRSNPPIVRMANACISNNQKRFERASIPAHFGGSLPIVIEYADEEEEADSIAWHLKSDHSRTNLDHVAVLYRASYQAAKLQLSLARRGVPFVVKGGVPFFAKPHVKDVVSWFKAHQNPHDKTSWHRCITMFPGIGETTFNKFWAELAGDPLGRYPDVKTKAKGWSGFAQGLETFVHGLDADLATAARRLLADISETLDKRYPGDPTERHEDLEELIRIVAGYGSIEEMLEEMALIEAAQENTYGVNLGTIHGAKGLEYKHVYLMGLNEGRFPSQKALADNLEEERRIFFVGATRAIETLRMSFAETTFNYDFEPELATPSRFLTELPEYLVDWRPRPFTVD